MIRHLNLPGFISRFSYPFSLCLLVVAFSSFECSKTTAPLMADISATAHSPSIPVLDGLAANPVLRILVSVPSGTGMPQYRSFACSVTNVEAIEKIDVYLTGAEPFSTEKLLTSYQPKAPSFQIPVEWNMQEGIKFIWFSVVLKDEMPVSNTLELHCTGLVDSKGRELPVKEDGSSFKKRTGVAIRKAGEDGVNTYRIPGIVQTDKGTLIAVYDIRYNNSADLPGNIDVGLSRSIDSGRSWQPMKVIMDMGGATENSGIGDPAVLYDKLTKKIWVAALWSKGNHSIAGSIGGLSPDSTGQFILTSSSDDGLTWSAPINITTQVKVPEWRIFFQGPGSGIQMENGNLVFAAQYWDASKMPYSTIVYSDDHGSSWKGKINGPKSNTTESQVVETKPGILMLNIRDNRGGFRSVATTPDMGAHWVEHPTSYNALPDPVCMGSLVKAKVKVGGLMKDVLFFSNPATSSGRYNITIKASLDMGETWLPAHQVLIDERLCYGYSSLTKIDDETIAILYEGIRDLYFVKVPVNEIIK